MHSLYLLLCLMLVASALIGLRMSLGKAVKMALAWVAIFGVGFMLFAFRGEFTALGSRLRAEATGAPMAQGGEVRLAMREDGHFWVDASINGRSAPFLIDSGASITTITPDLATAAKVETGIRTAQVETANGTVQMKVAKVDRLEVGPIFRPGFTVHVSQADNTNVLGMNFLSSLQSWRVERNTLVLQP